MNILIDGTSIDNKGAELMAISILQEIENRVPSAKIYYLDYADEVKKGHFDTSLKIHYCKKSFLRKVVAKLHLVGFFNRLHIPFPMQFKPVYKKIDILFDAGGFQFGDNWNYSVEHAQKIKKYYAYYHKHGTKIVFLPQSFGTFNSDSSKIIIDALERFSTLIYPRDLESCSNLKNGGIKRTLNIYPDFTCNVKNNKNINGFESNIDNKTILIIPNCKMLEMTNLKKSDYINFFTSIITYIQGQNFKVCLLNHEGIGDEKLCYEISQANNYIQVLTGLHVLQIKQCMENCCGVISGRFHGVANALSAGKPCIATAWNVKYKNLYADYSVPDMIIDCVFNEDTRCKLDILMDKENNKKYSELLEKNKIMLLNKIEKMWNEIFNVLLK